MTFFDNMIVKDVPNIVRVRTKENVESFHMSLSDAFKEACKEYAKKGTELYDAWYADDFRAYIPSAYQKKYLDFEKYPLKYNMQQDPRKNDYDELIRDAKQLGGNIAKRVYKAYEAHIQKCIPEASRALNMMREAVKHQDSKFNHPVIMVEGDDMIMAVTNNSISFTGPNLEIKLVYPITKDQIKYLFYINQNYINQNIDGSFEEKYEQHLNILKAGLAISNQMSALGTGLAVEIARIQKELGTEVEREKKRISEFRDEISKLKKEFLYGPEQESETSLQIEEDGLNEER